MVVVAVEGDVVVAAILGDDRLVPVLAQRLVRGQVVMLHL